MKKVFVSILAIVYLSTSMGATVRLHYCMGRLVSWGLTDHSGNSCSFCGMQKMHSSGEGVQAMKSCCHDESMQFRNDKDQKSAQEMLRVMKAAPAVSELPQPEWVDAAIFSPVRDLPVSNGPPLKASVPVYLRNRNFRI
ncbi:MAG: hypothetical protein JST42_11830 [Bacteroidetes bacterium]|nr:hypothetical protein [Bacteroidota bacterium]